MGGIKIGYLIPRFPAQTHAFFWREITELARIGAEVEIISTRLPPVNLMSHNWSGEAIARTEYLDRPRLSGAAPALAWIPGAIWREARRGGFLRDLLLCAEPARRIAQLCAARRITHLHAHSCGRAALIAALARLCHDGVPYSLTLHGPLADYGPGQALKWRDAAFATVITRRLLDEVEATLGAEIAARCVVQPMGVDTERFTRGARYRPPEPGTPLRIFACGRLNPVKGHAELIEAVGRLARRGIDARLDIAGEDETGGSGYRRVLDARIGTLGLGDRVRLLGAIGEEDVRTQLNAAHIFALASWHEPLGVAYMEAMSCGLPVIGTDAGGVRELISDGENGVIVPPRDPEALAGAIAALATDPDRCRRLGIAARARVVSRFRSGIGAHLLLEQITRAAETRRRDLPRPASRPLALAGARS